MSETRQQRRAREREAAKAKGREDFDRIHGQVTDSRTVQHLYNVYAANRFTASGMNLHDPAFKEVVEHAFYAGCASMMELMMRVSPDDVSEDAGVKMLDRLCDELDAYANRGAH